MLGNGQDGWGKMHGSRLMCDVKEKGKAEGMRWNCGKVGDKNEMIRIRLED